MRPLCRALLLVAVFSMLAGCAAWTATTPEQDVARCLGTDTQLVGVSPNTAFPGFVPSASYEISVNHAPTAAAVMSLLEATARRHSGHQIHLRLHIPGSRVLDFRWNPTAKIGVGMPTRSAAPHGLYVDIGQGNGLIGYGPDMQAIELASNVTTAAIGAAAQGKGALVARIRTDAGLP